MTKLETLRAQLEKERDDLRRVAAPEHKKQAEALAKGLDAELAKLDAKIATTRLGARRFGLSTDLIVIPIGQLHHHIGI